MDREAVLPNLLAARAEVSADRVLARDVEGRAMTTGQVLDAAQRWAGALRGLGVRRGDTVLVQQPTSLEAYAIWLGVAMLGAVEVPINPQHRGNLLAHIVTDSRARVMVSDARYVDSVVGLSDGAGGVGDVETVVVTGHHREDLPAAGVRWVTQRTLLQQSSPVSDWDRLEPWDTAAVLYTSGTTGPSKGVRIPWAQAHATAMGNGPSRTLRVPETVIYQPYPTFHVSGKYAIYNALLGGGEIVVREKFDTRQFWDDVRRFGCTYTILMGTTANILLRQPERAEDADNPMKAVLFSPWMDDVELFKRRFDVEAYSVFNMTEVSCPIVAGWDGGTVTKPKSCGRAREGYELRVVDENDQQLPAGAGGELVVRSAAPWTLMAGYWGMPEKTLQTWRNGWLHTGDLFSVDEDGDYFYLDRTKDAIRRRGENISSVEVEAEVLAHPSVLEVAAVAVDDELSEQEVKVCVVLKPGNELRPEELIGFLSERMAAFMVPRYVELLDALPKTATEKIRKNELRDRGVTPGTWDRTSADVRSGS